MSRVVALPTGVTEKEGRADFRNGVPGETLKKRKQAIKTRFGIT
jgi:HSP20 family molecular chaperone IbpA